MRRGMSRQEPNCSHASIRLHRKMPTTSRRSPHARQSSAGDATTTSPDFLFPTIPCDNNPAERAIRPAVLKRKVSQGSKTGRGTKATDVLLTVPRTLGNAKPANFMREFL
jgi:hypothetical protein